jgi:hypothetical protein
MRLEQLAYQKTPSDFRVGSVLSRVPAFTHRACDRGLSRHRHPTASMSEMAEEAQGGQKTDPSQPEARTFTILGPPLNQS